MAYERLKDQDPKMLELELDIDERLLELWESAEKVEEWNLEIVAAYMRAAYGDGYSDALKEIPEERATLNVEHGFAIPLPRPLPRDIDS